MNSQSSHLQNKRAPPHIYLKRRPRDSPTGNTPRATTHSPNHDHQADGDRHRHRLHVVRLLAAQLRHLTALALLVHVVPHLQTLLFFLHALLVALLPQAGPQSLPLRPSLRHPRTPPAQAAVRVDPLEGARHYVADIRQVQEEEGHADDGVHDGGYLALDGVGRDVAVP
jgi:hypothetical protein